MNEPHLTTPAALARATAKLARAKADSARKASNTAKWPTLDEVVAELEADDFSGFCLSCGAVSHDVEPDAEKYECDECGKREVYGAELVFISGKYRDDAK